MSDREMALSARKYVLNRVYIVNTVLLVCHLAFVVLYSLYDMYILSLANFVNIAICLLAFVALKKQKFRKYVHLLFYELYAFMIISIIFLGWEYSFQHSCMSFTVAIFFCDFYLNKDRSTSWRAAAMGVFNMLLYCGLRIWTYYFPHIYTIGNPTITKVIFVVHSMLTFFFIIMYMFMYSNTVNKLERELRDMAEKDPLTCLYNRRKMIQTLSSVIDSDPDYNVTLAMFDVDYFKQINDTYGHDAGDEVLKKLSDILANHNPDSSKFFISRWGGEEFLALYIHDLPHEAVIEEFDSLRQTIENFEIIYKNQTLKMTVTIGLAFYQNGASLEELLKEVDTHLYNGKEAGRNRLSYAPAKA